MFAPVSPSALSCASRLSAFALSSETSPKLMEPVGQALAHAVPRPLWIRSLHRVHLCTVPVFSLKAITPNGHDGMQYLQPMQTSCWTTTLPMSVRMMALVGQAFRQPASLQCLHESLSNSQRALVRFSLNCSMKRTCRQSVALNAPVLS